MAPPAAATRKDHCVNSAAVSWPRSQTSRGGLTTRFPPSSRSTRTSVRFGRTICPPVQLKRVTLIALIRADDYVTPVRLRLAPIFYSGRVTTIAPQKQPRLARRVVKKTDAYFGVVALVAGFVP